MCARIVDHYELHEELGRGGMATVYRATDLRLQREVALKLLHAHIADQPESRSRFIREARAAARLHHPNILHIYDFSGEDAGVGYLATELIHGPTLREMESRDLRAYPEIAACLLWILSCALEEAHNAGVIHRDIKPENIMIDDEGQPRLMDFGLARLRDSQRMTMTGTLLGSPAHMAPEIIHGEDYDGRVDIFALGTVLYFLCTGSLPFDAESPAALLRKILMGEYTPANTKNERVLAPLQQIIARMLATDPDDRFKDAAALSAALREFLMLVGIDAPERTFREWWTEGELFFAHWKPTLIAAVQHRAECALERDQGSISQALDWTNRLLTLDPQSEAGHTLLLRISSRSNRARLYQYAGISLLTILAIATPLLLVRFFFWPAALPSQHTDNFIFHTVQMYQHQAQELWVTHQAQTQAADVVKRTQALQDPHHVLATHEAQNILHRTVSAAHAQSSAIARVDRRPKRRDSAAKSKGSTATSPPTTGDAIDGAQAPVLYEVRVLAQPPVSEVYVDGEKRCNNATRCRLTLPPGTYEFMARHPATEMETRRAVRIEQEGTEVRLRVPWKPATLIVECDRPGTVILDGKRVGRTGDSIRVNIEGLHSTRRSVVRIIPDGDFAVPIERTVELSSGETRRERVQF